MHREGRAPCVSTYMYFAPPPCRPSRYTMCCVHQALNRRMASWTSASLLE